MISSNQNSRNAVVVGIFLVVGILIAYEPVRKNQFVIYDDSIYITENPNVNQGLSLKSIEWAFLKSHSGHWHPLTWISHMVDCELFGLNPKAHHFVGLGFHITNTLLLFWILKSMTGNIWASAFVTATFAFHPTHVESVAWAAERKNVLSGFFWMLAIAAYISYTRKPGILRYALLFLFLICGLLSKAMVVTLPVILLLLDYWPLKRLQISSSAIKASKTRIFGLIIEKAPLMLPVLFTIIMAVIAAERDGTLATKSTCPLYLRFGNAVVSYVSYIFKMLYPVKLAALYPLRTYIPFWKIVICMAVLLAITAFVIYLIRSRPYLFVGWFWYLVVLVPVIGIVQVGAQSMADRYTYLSSLGFFVMIAWGINDLMSGYKYKKLICWMAALVVIFAMIILSRKQVAYWKDSLTLCKHATEATENNYLMYDNYGRLLGQKGDYKAAMQNLSKACAISPKYTSAINNLGMALKGMGKTKEAIQKWEGALLIDPNNRDVNYNLGTTMMELGNYDKAIVYFEKVLKNKPDFVEVLNNMAYALAVIGNPKVRNPGRAVELAGKACELTGNKQPVFLDTLAIAYAASGDFTKAVDIAEQAAKISQSTEDVKMAEEIRSHIELFKKKISVVESTEVSR